MSEDLTLIAEVQARRALRKQPIRIAMLAPYGAWIGRGMLRVLRLRMPAQPFDEACTERSRSAQDDDVVELTVGYESYEPLTIGPGPVTSPEAVS